MFCQNHRLFKVLSHIMTYRMRASDSAFLLFAMLFSESILCSSVTFHNPHFSFRLSRSRKFSHKIPKLSRFSMTRRNPAVITTKFYPLKMSCCDAVSQLGRVVREPKILIYPMFFTPYVFYIIMISLLFKLQTEVG